MGVCRRAYAGTCADHITAWQAGHALNPGGGRGVCACTGLWTIQSNCNEEQDVVVSYCLSFTFLAVLFVLVGSCCFGKVAELSIYGRMR